MNAKLLPLFRDAALLSIALVQKNFCSVLYVHPRSFSKGVRVHVDVSKVCTTYL